MANRPLPSSFDGNVEYQETGWQKISRKLREEPLIPLGTALTGLALFNAWRAIRRGDRVGAQRMFRARVGAQAFTILAMVAGGAYYGEDRAKRKELIKLQAQQRAEEQNQRWLHELEVRDEEDKKLQVALKRKRDRLDLKRAADQEKEKEKLEKEEEEKEKGEKKGLKKEKAKEGDKGNKEKDKKDKKEGVDDSKTDNVPATPEAASNNGSAVLSALSSSTGSSFGAKKDSTTTTTTEQTVKAEEEKTPKVPAEKTKADKETTEKK